MRQKFYTTTLVSDYIKYLLSNTYIPLFPIIEEGQYMIQNCVYQHKNLLLRCYDSGVFSDRYTTIEDATYLTASEYVRVQSEAIDDYITIFARNYEYNKELDSYVPANSYSVINSPLVVTNELVSLNHMGRAKFDILQTINFGENIPNITTSYMSNVNYYDEHTHVFLGYYLRLLKNYYNINLMSLYNCYGGKSVTDIYIDKTANPQNTPDSLYIYNVAESNNKVLLVPIRFNTTYTVYIDSDSDITFKGLFYNRNLITGASNTIIDKPINYNSSTFYKPVTIRIDNTNEELQKLERYLHLGIQVTEDTTSTLVVLEGDYSNIGSKKILNAEIFNANTNADLTQYMMSTPSLIQTSKQVFGKGTVPVANTGVQYPFSDKLLSYLLKNTIDIRDTIDDNIANVETAVKYNPRYKGIWNTSLQYTLYNQYMNLDNVDKTDILGYVDKDIEDAVRKGIIVYGK